MAAGMSMNRKPCAKCGGTDFNASRQCRPCQAARGAKWAAANAEKARAQKAAAYQADRQKYLDRAAARFREKRAEIDAYKAQWNQANAGKQRAYSAKWRATNPERRKQVVRAWELRNKDAVRASRHNRRARVQAAPGRQSPGLRRLLFKLQRGKCACCRRPLGTNYELDHVMPLALGGSNSDENAQLLCGPCNRRKSARHPIDFMQSRGFLL